MSFQIESFSASTNKAMYDSEYFEKTWKVLEQAINDILKQNSSSIKFEELYWSAYHLVLYKHGEKLYSGLVTTMMTHVKEVSRSIEATQGDVFLEELNRKWADYNKALQMILDLLMYMDRTFVPSTHKTQVHELGINLWRDNIVHSSEIQTRLLNALLQLVNIERTGDTTKKVLLRDVMQMLLQTSQSTMQEFYARIDDNDLVAEIKNQLQYPSAV